MARLSVNLNKIALLRNSRRTGVPDVVRFGRIAHDAGADGLTMHPRPDERHIRRDDVLAHRRDDAAVAAEFRAQYRRLSRSSACSIWSPEIRPEQCTLVPDAPGVLTSEEGWKLGPEQRAPCRCRRSPR